METFSGPGKDDVIDIFQLPLTWASTSHKCSSASYMHSGFDD